MLSSSSSPLRLGIVGLRNIGLNHLRCAQALDDVVVVAGADTDSERAKKVKDDHSLSYVSQDAQDLFQDPNIDGVILALPNHLHAPLSIAALQAGKHVLVEKPISGHSQEVQGMVEARDRSGKTLMVGMNQRFSPNAYAIREQIRSKAIGEIYLSKTFWNRRYPFEGLFHRGSWGFEKKSSGGGPLLDLGIHKLDLLMFFDGFPRS